MKKVKVKRLPGYRKMANGGKRIMAPGGRLGPYQGGPYVPYANNGDIFLTDGGGDTGGTGDTNGYVYGTNKFDIPGGIDYGDVSDKALNYGVPAARMLSGVVEAASERKDGGANVAGKALSRGLQGATIGAQLGSIVPGIGTFVGGGIGAIAGAVTGGVNATKRNKEVAAAKKAEVAREKERRDSYSRGVLASFPTTGVKEAGYFMGYGGRMKMPYMYGGKKMMPNGGKTELNPDQEFAFQEWKKTLPENLQSDTEMYDLRGAWLSGEQPEYTSEINRFGNVSREAHLFSRNPNTGQILKSPNHPTYDKTLNSEFRQGYYPSMDVKTGTMYTQPYTKPLSPRPFATNQEYGYGGKAMYAIGGAMMQQQMQGQQVVTQGGMAEQGINPQSQGMPVQGGEVEPVATGVSEVVGPRHEQGGVDIGANTEVEGGEVMQNTQEGVNVFSDRLEAMPGVTFAEQAAKLGEEKAKFEQDMQNAQSIYERNSAKRNIQKKDVQMKRLFDQQEAMKMEQGIENPEGQAAFGQAITGALPYVDNITNAIITAKTPEIPEPVYDQAAPLQTRFNINPQMTEINRQQANLRKNLESNVSSSANLRGSMIASGAMATQARNQLFGQKENMETQLKNQDALNRQQVNMANVAKENQYNMLRMNRIDDIHQRISGNVANMAQDAQMQIAEENLRKKDALTLEIVKQKYKESGVFDRNIDKLFTSYENGDITFKEFQDRMKQINVK